MDGDGRDVCDANLLRKELDIADTKSSCSKTEVVERIHGTEVIGYQKDTLRPRHFVAIDHNFRTCPITDWPPRLH